MLVVFVEDSVVRLYPNKYNKHAILVQKGLKGQEQIFEEGAGQSSGFYVNKLNGIHNRN